MSIDTGANKVRALLDTNIIISAIGFGGKPRKILSLVLNKQIQGITSAILLAEFEDIIFKKFPLLANEFEKTNKQIRKQFKIVKPKTSLQIVKDKPDNRVLEAAFEGKCNYIVTGDKELLDLSSFENIKIINADEFLSMFEKS